MGFPKSHGLTIAQNGYIENMVVESLSSDPTVVEAGRCWFNETEKLFKFSSLNGGGGVVVRAIKDKEDYDAFVASISSTASNNSGAHQVGYDGQSGGNGQLSISAGNVANALDSLVTNIDQAMQEIDDITGGGESSISSLQSEIDATQTGAGLGTDGTYQQPSGSNYLDASTSLANADSMLDARAKANADAIAAEQTARSNADDLKVDLAGDTMGGNLGFADTYRITGLAEPVDPSDAATKNYVDAFAAGLDPKESARCATTGNIDLSTGGLLTIDGVNVAAGDRVLVKDQSTNTQNGIYVVVDGGAWTRATDFDGTPANEVSGGSFCFIEEGTLYQNMGFVVQAQGTVTVDTDPILWVQFSGAGQVIAGAGIAKTGNEIYLKFGAGIIELPGDEIGIDLRGGGGLFLTEDGSTDSTNTDAEIGIKLDGGTLSLSAAGLRLSDATNTTISGLQNELDNTQSGAGLGTGGSYSADGTADYIDSATSLFNADQLMDDQIKVNTDAIAAETLARTNADTAMQSELDATQAGAGLSAAGAYTAPASNYLGGSTDIVDGLSQLDSAIKSNEDDIAQEISDRTTAVSNEQTARSNADSALQSEIDAIESAMGSVISTAGAYVAFSGTNYIDGNTNVAADLTDLDTAIKGVSDALDDAVGGGSGTTLSSLQDEIDNVQASIGGAVDSDGVYQAFSGTNYINGNSDLSEDLTDLDTQVKANTDAIASNDVDISNLQTEVDNVESAMGAVINTSGNYVAFVGANYISGNSSVAEDLTDLDTQVKANTDAIASNDSDILALQNSGGNAQTEIDAIETAMGSVIGTDGAYVAFTGTNYINGNANVAEDLTDLDARAKTNADNITSNDADILTLQNEASNIQSAMGTAINASGNYVAHTGTNYIDGNTSVTGDLLDLDSQVKTNADAISTANGVASTLQGELDDTQAGAGLGIDGSYSVDALSNYLTAADFASASLTASVNSAVKLLDTALKAEEDARTSAGTAVQTEVNNIESAMGGVIDSSGDYVAFSGTNYINSNSDVAEDLTDLDTQVKANADAITAEAAARASDVDNSIDALETAIDDLVFTFTSSGAGTSHTVNHALGDEMVDVTVWVKDDDLKYRNDLVGITITDSNNVTVDLTESREIKCIVRSTAALA